MSKNLPKIPKLSLRGGVAVVALAVAAPFHAGAADSVNLEEVVVTAQRRAENLQAVPISITAISSEQLGARGITSTLSLPQVAPGVQMTKSGLSSIFFIRGVGNSSGGTGEEGANAFYIDGVYLADLQQANTEFNNINRVEVLKGPQGTLFGRNASGGLVNVITKDPGDKFEAKGSIGYGKYDLIKGQAYVAGPVSDKLSVDLAFSGRHQKDGFGRNIFNGTENMRGWYWGLRSKALWRPNDRTRIVLAGDLSRAKDDFSSGFTIPKGSFSATPAGTTLATPGTYAGPGGIVLFGDAGDFNRNSSNPGTATIGVWGVSLTADVEFDFAKLTNITAVRQLKAISNVDSDYGPAVAVELHIPSKSSTFQEELRLSSLPGGRLTWQVGGFFFRARAGVYDQILFGIGGPGRGQLTTSIMTTHSYSGFGEVSYDITPTTHATLGYRYTRENRKLEAVQTPFNQVVPALVTAFTFSKNDRISYNKSTYRAALRQDITDGVNVYASYNRGFKAGLWALQSPAGTPVRPQVTDAFEIGLKSELFDRRLRLNLAGYHNKVKDYQIRAAPLGALAPILLNASSVKVDGFEADFQFAATQELLLHGNLNIMNSRFGTFNGAIYTYPRPAVCAPAGSRPVGSNTGPLTGGNLTCLGPASGNKTPLSPKFTSNIGATYTMPVGQDSEMAFNILYSHNSGYFFEQDNRLRQPAFDLINGSIEYRFGKNIAIEIWGNNITDERYYITVLGSNTADHGELQAPRTFGVNLKFNY